MSIHDKNIATCSYISTSVYISMLGHPVEKHAFNKYRHQAPAFLNRLLEPPVPVGIHGEQRFAGLDEFAFFGMEENTGSAVMRCSCCAGKGDQGLVIHLDHIPGCRGIDNKLVFTGDNIS